MKSEEFLGLIRRHLIKRGVSFDQTRAFSIIALPNIIKPTSRFFSPIYEISKILTILDVSIKPMHARDPIANCYINWNDVTKLKFDVPDYIQMSRRERGENKQSISKGLFLNGELFDISKQHIGGIYEKIFNENILINPEEYKKPYLIKSNLNAIHKSKVVNPSISLELPKKDQICSILINNESDGFYIDHRVPIIRGTTGACYIKTKEREERFSNSAIKCTLDKLTNVMSNEEIKLVNSFCRELKMDYGNLDVLRDFDSGKLFIVDANKTPGGPPPALSPQDTFSALTHLAEAFYRRVVIPSFQY